MVAGVKALFDKYALRNHDHLMVIADRLLVLDRLVIGRYWTVSSAVNKAKREAKQILSLINRVSYRAEAQARGTIVCWDEIAETAQYSNFAQRLQHAVLADQMLAETIQAFVERRVERYGLGELPERERDYEREYLLSEVSMSVFCTEVLGFSHEVVGATTPSRPSRSAETALRRARRADHTSNRAPRDTQPDVPLS